MKRTDLGGGGEFKSFGDEWRAAIREGEIDALTQVSTNIVRSAIIKAPVFLGWLRRAIRFSKPAEEQGHLTSWIGFVEGEGEPAKYGLFVENGRDPGKAPPPGALNLWVKRKWNLAEKDVPSAAFLLGRHIAEHGTKEQPFLRPAYYEEIPNLPRILKSATEQALRKRVKH